MEIAEGSLGVLDGYAFAAKVVGFVGGVAEGEHVRGEGLGFSALRGG